MIWRYFHFTIPNRRTAKLFKLSKRSINTQTTYTMMHTRTRPNKVRFGSSPFISNPFKATRRLPVASGSIRHALVCLNKGFSTFNDAVHFPKLHFTHHPKTKLVKMRWYCEKPNRTSLFSEPFSQTNQHWDFSWQ